VVNLLSKCRRTRRRSSSEIFSTAFSASVSPRHDKPGYAVVDDFGHRARLEGYDGRATGHGLDHDQTERFWPIWAIRIGFQSGQRID